MDNIIHISDYRPHNVSEVICLKCLKRWIAVRPSSVWLKDLECPGCYEAGYVIETGQTMEDEDA